jgi:CBS domain-containing protein
MIEKYLIQQNHFIALEMIMKIMQVTEIMVNNPVMVTPDTSVRVVAKFMLEKSIGSIILAENGRPVGIITERDLVRRVLALGKNRDSLTALEICSKPVIAISEMDQVDNAVDLMKKNEIRRLVVVNMNDRVVGIVTTDDIGYNLKRMSEELAIEYMVLSKRGKSKFSTE